MTRDTSGDDLYFLKVISLLGMVLIAGLIIRAVRYLTFDIVPCRAHDLLFRLTGARSWSMWYGLGPMIELR